MNNFKRILAIIIVLATTSSKDLFAQKSQEIMLEAYLTSSKLLWQQAIKNADNDWQKSVAHYGLLNATMATQDEDLFDQYVDPTLGMLSSLEEANEYNAQSMALRAGVYGLIMAYSPWKSMVYGIKSSNNLEEAMELEPDNPLVLATQANSLYYTPESFGGDQQKSAELYAKSIALYEQQTNHKENWLYLQTLANAGQVYSAIGQKEQAIQFYEKALGIAPNFYYVSKVLLPKAQAK